MPSIEPSDLVIPFTDDYSVIPSTEKLHCDSFYKTLEPCHSVDRELHCDSFYKGLHCDSRCNGSCTGSDIVNPSTEDCIVIPSIESYM